MSQLLHQLLAAIAGVSLLAAHLAGGGNAGSASSVGAGPGPMASYAVQAQPPAGSCHYRYVGTFPLPDATCTPGAVNPDVTQADLDSTICSSGYASDIRPPESVTEPEKEANARSYGYTGPLGTAEYDHLVPLELGGDPNDEKNLWVEPNDDPYATSVNNTKDVLEDTLNHLVCSGQVTLSTAQDAIASDWVTAYQTYVGRLPVFSAPSAVGGARCSASAAAANDGYSGDYDVSVTSDEPHTRATASDATDSWSDDTDGSGSVVILLYHTSPGEEIRVTVGSATCSTTA